MFQLSVVDHVRLSFGQVVQNYIIHARTAERLTALSWTAKVVVLTLLGIAAAAAIAAVLAPNRPLQITAAVCAALAFGAYAVHVALDVGPRVLTHRAAANRLWLIAERYRSLLAEIHDGQVERAEIHRRRDELLQQVHTAYEYAAPGERQGDEAARLAEKAAALPGLTDEQIDRFLPPSLRKGPPAEATRAAESEVTPEERGQPQDAAVPLR